MNFKLLESDALGHTLHTLHTLYSIQGSPLWASPLWASPKAIIVLGLLASLLLWRLWRFTIFPMLHPNYAKELPYWIPCMPETLAGLACLC
jgi:hypothetical protein